ALKGGYDALSKYGFELHALSPVEAESMRIMAEHGDLAGVQRVAYEALARTLGGDFQRSLSDLDKYFIKLGASWHDLIENLSKNDALTRLREDFLGLVTALSKTDFGPLAEQIRGVLEGIKTSVQEIERLYRFVQSLPRLSSPPSLSDLRSRVYHPPATA